ncbi:A-kinase anchor protein 17A [Amia ocellicauda]|uniref:A-kinase anchor protein 17A n=1 Tax=Amia ocellicauda TaxID=2972642 RepID=UPI0034645118|nr:AK17A protein [Amia calva]
MSTTIVHDTTEAVKLCPALGLYLKPIAKLTVSVALPQLKQPGKSISNWEVMERLKAMVQPDLFSALRISKSTMEFIRFEGEVENRGVVRTFLSKLDGKTIKLSGFTDILKVRAAEYKMDFPTRHDWDSFFRDAKDMNETVPGERPDTIHLEGLPCKWFAAKDSASEKPCEAALQQVFEAFGKIRNVDIPMLDPYREEMMDKNFHTFSFGGHLNFEGYVQFQEYIGFVKAMDGLRGMKLMYRGEDGKAVACNMKVTFDTTKHLSETAMKKRQMERQKLQELERQREEQKRKEKEEEERRKEEERRQRELEEEEKERKREEKLRKREQKQREREEKKNLKKVKKQQAEEQKKLHLKIALEERKLLLAQRNLESIRLIAELLSRAKAQKQQEREQREAEKAHLLQLEERRRLQEVELRRVEEEKARALELQRKERELRERLLDNLLKKGVAPEPPQGQGGATPSGAVSEDSSASVKSESRTSPAPLDAKTNGAFVKGACSSQVNGFARKARAVGENGSSPAQASDRELDRVRSSRCSREGIRHRHSSRERRRGGRMDRHGGDRDRGDGDRDRRGRSRDSSSNDSRHGPKRSHGKRDSSRQRGRGHGSRSRERSGHRRGKLDRHRGGS